MGRLSSPAIFFCLNYCNHPTLRYYNPYFLSREGYKRNIIPLIHSPLQLLRIVGKSQCGLPGDTSRLVQIQNKLIHGDHALCAAPAAMAPLIKWFLPSRIILRTAPVSAFFGTVLDSNIRKSNDFTNLGKECTRNYCLNMREYIV